MKRGGEEKVSEREFWLRSQETRADILIPLVPSGTT